MKNGATKHPRLIELEKKIVAKLEAEGLSISSPWEKIRDCLSKTVAPDFCLSCARDLRDEIGIEISEEHCEIAKQRIINETRQLKFRGF